jgi:class 3 adenylate cyclase
MVVMGNIEGERGTVTTLFADIKGSTELEQGPDPEKARAIIDPALKLMIDAVRHYDGDIVQSAGDGIFALFGAPVAREDHPQLALYAALRMQEELKRPRVALRRSENFSPSPSLRASRPASSNVWPATDDPKAFHGCASGNANWCTFAAWASQ